MIRVLIADDEALMRTGIRLILENDDEVDVVAEAQDAHEAVAACRTHPVDVALLDIRMPGDGLTAVDGITRHSPRTRAVMLTAFGEEPTVTAALRAGAHGYLLKDTGPRDLIDAIHRAAAGDPVLAPQVTRQLVDFRTRQGHTNDAAAQRIAGLTPTERDVLQLLGTGLSNAGIATRLHLSSGTVKAHISSILTRTDCANRVQAAVLAQEAGLLS